MLNRLIVSSPLIILFTGRIGILMVVVFSLQSRIFIQVILSTHPPQTAKLFGLLLNSNLIKNYYWHHSTDHLIRILRQWINFVTLSTKYSRILLLIIHKCWLAATLIYQELTAGTSYSVLSHKDVQLSTTLIDCILENCLSQAIKYPTRGQNILDLMFTSNQNLLSNEVQVPSPSHDHDALFFELNLKPRLFKVNNHFTYLCKKADIIGLDNELNQLVQEFSTRDPTNFSW